MTYAYYVCATVIDDETATMCCRLQLVAYLSMRPIWFPRPSVTKHNPFLNMGFFFSFSFISNPRLVVVVCSRWSE